MCTFELIIKQILHGISLNIAIYQLEVGDIQRRKAELNILLWELINLIFNGNKTCNYVLLITTKNIQIYSKNSPKTPVFGLFFKVQYLQWACNNMSIIARSLYLREFEKSKIIISSPILFISFLLKQITWVTNDEEK